MMCECGSAVARHDGAKGLYVRISRQFGGSWQAQVQLPNVMARKAHEVTHWERTR